MLTVRKIESPYLPHTVYNYAHLLFLLELLDGVESRLSACKARLSSDDSFDEATKGSIQAQLEEIKDNLKEARDYFLNIIDENAVSHDVPINLKACLPLIKSLQKKSLNAKRINDLDLLLDLVKALRADVNQITQKQVRYPAQITQSFSVKPGDLIDISVRPECLRAFFSILLYQTYSIEQYLHDKVDLMTPVLDIYGLGPVYSACELLLIQGEFEALKRVLNHLFEEKNNDHLFSFFYR